MYGTIVVLMVSLGRTNRMAIELELDQPPPPDCDERQALNRTRTWLNCYCVDGSHAIQFGKMPMLRLDGYLARTSQDWYRSSLMNIAYDIHLCAYVQMIVIMARWRSLVADGDLKVCMSWSLHGISNTDIEGR
jgi:transcriptional regulatory protein LEU3